MTPNHYLVAKYLGDEGAARDHALAQVMEQLRDLPNLLANAGLQQPAGRRGRG